jgi:hypothetical protein
MGQFLNVFLHDYNLSHGIYPLAVAAVILAWNRGQGLRWAIRSRVVRAAAIGLAGLILATYTAILILRLFSVLYGDHLEALVASISWLVIHGRPGYPDWHDGDLYGGIYGPLLFWIDGAALLISPTIAATKLVAAGALVLGILGLWRLSNRVVAAWPTRLLLAAILIEQLLPYRFTSYWIRSEPFLYLFAALAILAGVARKPWAAILLIGLLAGLAVDLKIHGMLYLLPIGLLVLSRAEGRRQLALFVVGGALAAFAAFVAPALADPSVVLLYTKYLALAAGHGLSATAIVENIEIALGLAAPPAILYLWRHPRLAKEDMWFTAGLGLAALIVIVLGSKIGALTNYLMPLAPSFFYLAIRMLAAQSRQAEPAGVRHGLIATIFLVLFVCNAGSWLLMVQMAPRWASYNALMTDKRAEFVALLSAHPDAEAGVADDASYEDSYFSTLQVIDNGTLHIAVPAWMDLREGGISESYATKFITDCGVPAWILPKGAPFSIITPYTNRPLFSDEFRDVFAKNYNVIDGGKFYDVWHCRAGH